MVAAFPSGSGESRAEAQRRGGVFDLALGVGRFHDLPPTFGGIFLIYRFSKPRQLLKTASTYLHSAPTLFPPL